MRKITEDSKRIRTDRIIAILVGLAAGAVYLITLAPSVSFWDSGEYLTCSWTAGVPHPPGVPLFVLLGRFSTILFSFIPAVAPRVNLLCALSGAFAIGILARLVQRWGHRMNFDRIWYRPMSVLSGLIAAFSYSIWRNSNATETYATALLMTFIILLLFDCWIDRYAEKNGKKFKPDSGGWGEARYLLLISYLLILAVANHGSVPLIAGPPILMMYLIYAFRKRSIIWKKSWFILTMLGLVVLAFSVHLYMPLRAVQNPEINETDSTNWTNFSKAFSREQYGTTSIFERKGPFLDQMKLYLKYLSWQSGRVDHGWARLLGGKAGFAVSMLMKIILVFGTIYGIFVIGMKRPKLLMYLGLLFLMSSVLFIFFILNFKTGTEGTTLGEVRERDYFFGASFAFFAIFSGIGLVSILKDFLPERSKLAWIALLIPVASLAANMHRCDRSESFFARDYGINLLESCPENAVLITNGDNDTFPLWFAQGVLGTRRDVIVSNLSLMNTNWYVNQLIDRDSLLLDYRNKGLVDSLRPVFIWGPHYFHVNAELQPEYSPVDGDILRSSFNQAWPWAITDDRLAIAMPTEPSANQGALSMQDLVLLEMIRRKPIHGREIYFAGTVARDSRQFLENYQEMEGIAYRVTESQVINAVNSHRGWQLMNDYQFTGVYDTGVYKCDQTVQLLRNYLLAYHQLAYHYLSIGEPDSVKMTLDEAERLFITLPDEWAEILPTRAVIVAKLIDGLYGPAAARDTLIALSNEIRDEGERLGRPDLTDFGKYLSNLATGLDGSLGYQQKIEYDNLFEVLDDGSIPFAWLKVEMSLMFSDYIGAYRILDNLPLQSDTLSLQLTDLAHATLERIAETTPMNSRLNPVESGLFIIFEYIDISSSTEFRLISDTSPGDIIESMIALASRGQLMSSVSSGLVLANHMDDPARASIIQAFAERIIEDGVIPSIEWSEWYLTESNRVSPEAVAWMAAKAGQPEMMYASLSRSENVSEALLDEILRSPASYAASIPDPGRGSGRYSWVNILAGGSL
ncbi:MAG: DUF2723 domain-containing protein [Candidatus Aegiribacteria sp.]|nr:DUF2723 domain-containing protein [Candidatus Aegiribacteria sp.]